jgi:hypothetical protein
VSRRGFCRYIRGGSVGKPGKGYAGPVDRLTVARRRNVAAICFPIGATAINADVVQLRGGHRQQGRALALNTELQVLLLHPLTQYLREAASQSDSVDGEVVWAIFSVVSHGDTYQFMWINRVLC